MNKFNRSVYELEQLMKSTGTEESLLNEYKSLLNEYGMGISFNFKTFVTYRLSVNYSLDDVKQKLDYIR